MDAIERRQANITRNINIAFYFLNANSIITRNYFGLISTMLRSKIKSDSNITRVTLLKYRESKQRCGAMRRVMRNGIWNGLLRTFKNNIITP